MGMDKVLFSLLIGFLALVMAGPSLALPLSPGATEEAYVFYSGGGSSSPPPSDHGNSSSSDRPSNSNGPLGGTPGVQLPALVVPMYSGRQQAGYFYLTMALEVRGDDWAVREKVPFIQDALVRYVYTHPIPEGMSEEEALEILSEPLMQIAADIMQNDQVIGIIYRDVSTGF